MTPTVEVHDSNNQPVVLKLEIVARPPLPAYMQEILDEIDVWLAEVANLLERK